MMDVSDGLAIDLRRLAEASFVQMILDEEKIPVSEVCKGVNLAETLVEHALSDGEDFELCFTAGAADAAEIAKQGVLGVSATIIGEVQSGAGIYLRKNGVAPQPIEWVGFEH